MTAESTKRVKKFTDSMRKMGRVQWRVWVSSNEKEVLKTELKKMRTNEIVSKKK